jgi:hypothetical protein
MVIRVMCLAVAIVAAAVRLSGHDPIGTKVTWEREILPIVQARCVSCHSPGGRAPMSLRTYEEARPWARAIREEVLTRRMPQWSVVRGYGDFSNDPSLSAFEIALITSWVDGGAPKTRPAGISVRPVTAATPPTSPSALAFPSTTREVTLRCGAATLPAGTLVGLRPRAADGGSVRVTMATADGGEEPLLWIRGFSASADQPYWLRTARTVTSPTAVSLEGEGCSVTFLFEARTAR